MCSLKATSGGQVRDRATLYLSQLTGSAEEAVQPQWDVPAKNLEASLRAYLHNGATQAFDLVRLSHPGFTSILASCKVDNVAQPCRCAPPSFVPHTSALAAKTLTYAWQSDCLSLRGADLAYGLHTACDLLGMRSRT